MMVSLYAHREFRRNLLEASLGTPQRAIITARYTETHFMQHWVRRGSYCTYPHLSLYGDQRELDFWTVALYYILREKNRLEDPRYLVPTSLHAFPALQWR